MHQVSSSTRRKILGGLIAGVTAASLFAAPAAFASGAGSSDIVKTYLKPVAGYTGTTCVFNLSAIPDGTTLTSLTQCGMTATFSATMTKETVGVGWATWSSPPNSESAAPAVLWGAGATSVTITFSKAVVISGVEAEPDAFAVENLQASWYRGDGTLLGTQARDANGNAGAVLYAAKVNPKAKSLTIVDTAGDDFAIANLRVK